MKPRIGITTSLGTRENPAAPNVGLDYTRAIAMAGGVPLALLPVEGPGLVKEQLSAVDGVVLIGGPDYDPCLWDEELHPATNLISDTRQKYDIALARAADRMKLPMLGVCGGHQLINIIRGGAVAQDVYTGGLYPEPKCHSAVRARHRVDIEPGSLLARITGRTRLTTNSTHHQAISRAGRHLAINARCTDGVCEGIEDARPERFVVGVQWHPERLAPKSEPQLRIFQALVKAARKSRPHR